MPKGAGSVCGEWEVFDSGHRMVPITQSGSICLYRGEAKLMGTRAQGGVAQSRMTGLASLPLTTNEPPTLISWKLAASVPGVADRFPIAGPPSEKFAVRYTLAHHRLR